MIEQLELLFTTAETFEEIISAIEEAKNNTN